MPVRYYTAPQDDPNGNAGQLWATDDQNNFWQPSADELRAQNQQPGPGQPPSGPYSPYGPPGGEMIDPRAEALAAAAYRNRHLDTYLLPDMRWRHGFQDRQQGIDAGQFDRSFGLSNVLGRGNLALGGLGIAQQGYLGGLGAAQSAAGQAGQLGLQRAQLLASLRGPQDAWRQLDVNMGLNGMGGSNLAGALRGEQGVSRFQAPQAEPAPASLASVGGLPGVEDFLMRQAQGIASSGYTNPASEAGLSMGGGNAAYTQPGSPLADPGTAAKNLWELGKTAAADGRDVNDPNVFMPLWRVAYPGVPDVALGEAAAAVRAAFHQGAQMNEGEVARIVTPILARHAATPPAGGFYGPRTPLQAPPWPNGGQ